MDERLQALIAYLVQTKDPEEIVDFLDVDTVTLVDALYNFSDDWLIENAWRPEEVERDWENGTALSIQLLYDGRDPDPSGHSL
jgi:hypothetical protein